MQNVVEHNSDTPKSCEAEWKRQEKCCKVRTFKNKWIFIESLKYFEEVVHLWLVGFLSSNKKIPVNVTDNFITYIDTYHNKRWWWRDSGDLNTKKYIRKDQFHSRASTWSLLRLCFCVLFIQWQVNGRLKSLYNCCKILYYMIE